MEKKLPDIFETQNLIGHFDPSLSAELTRRTLLIVGLGGNGSHLALAAARMGFDEIIGVDRDFVSPSNLTRQVLYTSADVGQRKADSALRALTSHNLRSKLQIFDFDILKERSRFGRLVQKADLIFIVV